MKITDWKIGDTLFISRAPDDVFSEDFQGIITEINGDCITVVDQNGDYYDVDQVQCEWISE